MYHEKHTQDFKKNHDYEKKYQHLVSLVDDLPGDIYWKDQNFIWIGLNKNCANSLKKMGFIKHGQAEEVIGKTDFEIFNQASAEVYRKNDLEVINNNTEIFREETTYLPTGEQVVLLSIKRPLLDSDGTIIGISGNTIDITEQKKLEIALKNAKETAEAALQAMKQAQAEEQKQRNEAERLEIENTKNKAELEIAKISAEKELEMRKTVMVLVGDIVHDLRTPLAIIEDGANILEEIAPELVAVINEAEELKSEKLSLIDESQLNYVLNKMSIAQKYSVRMINEFIDTTLRELSVAQKYADGTIAHEELTKCSSRRILENVLDSYPFRNEIKINQCFPYDFFLMGNSILMMKVLFNLIRNAEEQIIANGKGEITITTKETEDKNLLIIKDTAGGAPPEVVENLFKEFFTTKKDGAGIGLAFCKKMMQNFGGDLTCNSVSGDFMEFILSFPKITLK